MKKSKYPPLKIIQPPAPKISGPIAYCDGGDDYWSYQIDTSPPVRGKHDGTSNQCEFQALIECLRDITTNKRKVALIHSDSKLVINQTTGIWKVKKPHLIPYAIEARKLLDKAGCALQWITRDVIEQILGH